MSVTEITDYIELLSDHTRGICDTFHTHPRNLPCKVSVLNLFHDRGDLGEHLGTEQIQLNQEKLETTQQLLEELSSPDPSPTSIDTVDLLLAYEEHAVDDLFTEENVPAHEFRLRVKQLLRQRVNSHFQGISRA